ncbi:hypothetical protein ABH917_001857 [Thermobifida halotolerans]
MAVLGAVGLVAGLALSGTIDVGEFTRQWGRR